MRQSTGCWSGSRARTILAVLPLVLLAVTLASGPARADGPCTMDKDCPGDLVCNAGSCMPANAPVAPPQPGTAPAATPASPAASAAPAATDLTSHGTTPEGGKCLSNPDCSPGNTCQNFICRQAFFEPRNRVMMGLMYEYAFGIGGTNGNGNTSNIAPAGNVNGGNLVGFALDAGTTVDEARRLSVLYHLELGYLGVDTPSIKGGHIAPLNVGFSYKVVDGGAQGLRVEIGPLLNATSIDLGVGTWSPTDRNAPNSQFTMFLQSGVALRAIVSYGSFFAAIVPAGLELRWLTFHTYESNTSVTGTTTEGTTETSAGVGLNWPIAITLGMQFEKQKD